MFAYGCLDPWALAGSTPMDYMVLCTNKNSYIHSELERKETPYSCPYLHQILTDLKKFCHWHIF